ncbi:MAG: hypothetical protein ACOYWZ_11120, partial [Bacillota bacterium]
MSLLTYDYKIKIGQNAAPYHTVASPIVAIGRECFLLNDNFNNIGIGDKTGRLNTGSNNIIIGHNLDTDSPTDSNRIIIGTNNKKIFEVDATAATPTIRLTGNLVVTGTYPGGGGGGGAYIIDTDGDTVVHTELNADEDTIRLKANNVEIATIDKDKVVFNKYIKLEDSPLLKEQGTPTTVGGYGRLYVSNVNNNLYFLDSLGVSHDLMPASGLDWTIDQGVNNIHTNNLIVGEIDHNSLLNYEANRHYQLDDSQTTATNLWSASKIQSSITAAGGVTTFKNLTDTPSTYSGYAGKAVAVKSTEDGLEFVSFPASGEVITASNVGTGAGVFYQKSGGNLQFNSVKSTNSLLTVALNGTSHEVELTVNQNAISHDALAGYSADQHFTIDDASTTAVNKVWSAQKTYNTIMSGISNNKIYDADNDTKIEVEKIADEDIIRFSTGGSQRMQIGNAGVVFEPTVSVQSGAYMEAQYFLCKLQTTAPSTHEGAIYYNSTDKKFYGYNHTGAVQL